MTDSAINPCIIIPVYNHPDSLESGMAAIEPYKLAVILVDDGSDKECRRVMQRMEKQYPFVTLITRQVNGGKGAAVKTGLANAQRMGFTHAIQVDADGQHEMNDIPRFISAAANSPNALIAGVPQYDESIPGIRYYARYLTHFWVWVSTLSLTIRDSMCGFRVYPVADSCRLIQNSDMGNWMDFDIEFIVRWYWQELPIQQLDTRVIYPQNNTSHFRLLKDNLLISQMLAKLFFEMLYGRLCRSLRYFFTLLTRKFR